MRIVAIAAAAGFVLLAGCDNQADPSPPPTTEDALTTATTAPTATPPDEVELTTDAAPSTVEPTTTEPVADDGPPEMPAEAEEQTEAGAEAFALHYLDLLNYTAERPMSGLLDELATSECASCRQFSTTVDGLVADEERYDSQLADYQESTAIHTNETAMVLVGVHQPELSVVNSAGDVVRTFPAESDVTMEFALVWVDSGWMVDKIFLLEQ